MISEWDRQTALTDLGDGAFGADLADGWRVGGGINGGYLLATIGSALSRVTEKRDPLSVSAYYVGASAPGPAEIRTRVVRDGGSVATRQNYLDLDPTYKDAWGLPLLRMTFDFPENDIKMSAYVTRKAIEIGEAMGGRLVVGSPRTGPYDITEYQTTHNTGGTIMGTDPSTSVVNRYLQSWDVANLFVIGASNYPQNACYNPSATLGALAYWSANAIVTKYLKSPGPLMSR